MLENKFVNMIKEELMQKETKLIEEEKNRVALEKTLRELKLKNITVPNKSTLYIQCVKYYSKLGIYRASAKNIRYYTQFFRFN